MELKALWKMFLRRWWLIALPGVVALALAVPDFLDPPGDGFTTTLRLTAAQSPSGDEPTYEDAAYMPWMASEYLINSLTAWVTTGSFAREVSRDLADQGIDISPDAVRDAVIADNARSLMALYITWPDAAQLEALAHAAVAVLQDTNQDYFPQLSTDPALVVALDDVVLAPASPSLLNRLRPVLRVMLALLVGIGLAALLEYLDDSVYSRDDLEAMELAVLGEIPRHKGLNI
jgi:capsular polysaccharide biosynthesis protein